MNVNCPIGTTVASAIAERGVYGLIPVLDQVCYSGSLIRNLSVTAWILKIRRLILILISLRPYQTADPWHYDGK